MRRISTIFFLLIALFAKAQYPSTQPIGKSNSLVEVLGGMKINGAFVNGRFADTTAANATPVKMYPGAQIIVGDTMFIRNSSASRWVAAGTGSTTLTNAGAGYKLFNPNTGALKTMAVDFGVVFDSTTNPGTLIMRIDSVLMATRAFVNARVSPRELYSIRTLGTISSNTSYSLPAPVDTSREGRVLIVNNTNGAGFTYNLSGAPAKYPDGTTIGSLMNKTIYQFIWDGTAWSLANSSFGIKGNAPGLYFSDGLYRDGDTVKVNPAYFPTDTIKWVWHGDTLFYKLISQVSGPDSTKIAEPAGQMMAGLVTAGLQNIYGLKWLDEIKIGRSNEAMGGGIDGKITMVDKYNTPRFVLRTDDPDYSGIQGVGSGLFILGNSRASIYFPNGSYPGDGVWLGRDIYPTFIGSSGVDVNMVGTGGFTMPAGTTAQRQTGYFGSDPCPFVGRFNTDLDRPEFYKQSTHTWYSWDPSSISASSVSAAGIGGALQINRNGLLDAAAADSLYYYGGKLYVRGDVFSTKSFTLQRSGDLDEYIVTHDDFNQTTQVEGVSRPLVFKVDGKYKFGIPQQGGGNSGPWASKNSDITFGGRMSDAFGADFNVAGTDGISLPYGTTAQRVGYNADRPLYTIRVNTDSGAGYGRLELVRNQFSLTAKSLAYLQDLTSAYTFSNGLKQVSSTVTMDDGYTPLTADVGLDGETNGRSIRFNAGDLGEISGTNVASVKTARSFFKQQDGAFIMRSLDSGFFQIQAPISFLGTTYTDDGTIDLLNSYVLLDNITSNKTLTLPYRSVFNGLGGFMQYYVLNRNVSANKWLVSGYNVQDIFGDPVTEITPGFWIFGWDNFEERWILTKVSNEYSTAIDTSSPTGIATKPYVDSSFNAKIRESKKWDIYEEFISSGFGGNFASRITSGGFAGNSAPLSASHIGEALVQTGTSSATASAALASSETITFQSGVTYTWVADDVYLNALNNTTDSVQLLVGFLDGSNSTSNSTDALCFKYDKFSNNWQCMAMSNGVATYVTSSITVSSGTYYDLGIVANSGYAEFFINGVSVGTITSNIPNTISRAVEHGAVIRKRAGTANRFCAFDRIKFKWD